MTTKTILTCFILGICFSISSQIKITGIVAHNSKPLPFVNIGIKGTYSGTTTNQNGEFSINMPSNIKYRTLVFSSIGYESKEVKITDDEKNLKIQLTPKAYDINEITIMPDSTLRSFLRKAFNRIPENYPTTPTKYNCFYRASIKSDNDKYIRFMEVLTNAYKSSYKNSKSGTVKIINSRKYLSKNHLNEFKTLFYGGVHFIHSVDFVKNRSEFLSGSNKYQYELLGIENYNSMKLYKIKFYPTKNNNKSSGFFYINTTNLAYLKIKLISTSYQLEQRSKSLTKFIADDLKSTSRWVEVNYEYTNKYSYLKSIFLNENIVTNKNAKYTSSVENVITSINDSAITNIPYSEQIPITYMPAIEAKIYEESDWKNYNTLPKSAQLEIDSIKSHKILSEKSNITFKEKLIDVFRKFELGYGLSTYKYQLPAVSTDLKYKHLSFNKNINTLEYLTGFYSTIDYRINKRNLISYKSTTPLSKENYIKIENLTYKHQFPIKTVGKQITGYINAGWELQKIGLSLGTLDSNRNFSFGGKKFKNDKTQAFTGQKNSGVNLGFGIDIHLSNLFYLNLSADYFNSLRKEDVIILKERSGFFVTRKTAYEKITNPNIYYSKNGLESVTNGIKNNNWSFGVGLKMKL